MKVDTAALSAWFVGASFSSFQHQRMALSNGLLEYAACSASGS